jgi:hypothetical protein
VTTQYRAVVAAEKRPLLRLRDGRTTSYAHTPLPAVHASSVAEYARRSREVTALDAALFYLVDGDPGAALDLALAGREVRPEFRPWLDEIAEAALAAGPDAAAKLAPLRDRLDPALAARLVR